MKNSIALSLLVLLIGFGCYKAENSSTPIDPAKSVTETPNVTDRGPVCCCDLVVSSLYFGGLTICGTDTGAVCGNFNTQCGVGGGLATVFPTGKNLTFCVYAGVPFSIMNNGIAAITISFNCHPGSSGTIPLSASSPNNIKYFVSDCHGTITPCDP